MKILIRAILIAGVLLPFGIRANGDEKESVVVKMSVAQIRGKVTYVNSSLTDDVFQGLDSPTKEQKKAFSCWVQANRNIGGVEFKANETAWTWDGKAEPDEDGPVRFMLGPRVMLNLGEQAEMIVGDRVPIQYFEKREDGLFDLKARNEAIGMNILFKVEKGEGNRIVLRDLTFSVREIESRTPIEGVQLDAGFPIISNDDYKISIALKPRLFYGLDLRTEGHGLYIIRIEVDTVETEQANPANRSVE
jgi:hypothetical protein